MEKKNYAFTQVPTNLFILMDNNCRSMLFTLIQLSSFYADENGWFFRTWDDLEQESSLSYNLAKATIQTLFNHHIIEAKPTGYGKGKRPNYYKVNFDEFVKYEEKTIEDCIKNPDFKIHTVDYKGSCFKLNLVRDAVDNSVSNTVTNTVSNPVKSDNNIDNIENVDNIENEKNVENKEECIQENISQCNTLEEIKKNDFFQEFKENVDNGLVGKNENELLNKRTDLSMILSRKRIELGSSLYNRCYVYLNRKYDEALATVAV